MAFSGHRPPISNKENLLDYLYWEIGTLTMDEIRTMIEVIELYMPLVKGDK